MANFPYRLYGGAARPDAISGLNPQFSQALEQLYAAAPPEVQSRLGLTSGYRSVARQQQLWDASDKTGHMVARPGHSKHNFGMAADLYGMGTGGGSASPVARDWVHANASKYGLAFPMSYEPWHIQLANGQSSPSSAPPATPADAGMPDGPKGQESYQPPAPFGSMAPPPSAPPMDNSIDPSVAKYAFADQNKDTLGNRLSEAGKDFSQALAPPKISASAFPGGPSAEQANGLLKSTGNINQLAQLLLGRRMS